MVSRSNVARFLSLLFVLSALGVAPPLLADEPGSLFRALDTNGDGALGRYEAITAWLRLNEEADRDGDGSISAEEWRQSERARLAEAREEFQEIRRELDENDDGKLALDEVPPEFQPAAKRADLDGDGYVSAIEFASITISPEDMLRGEIESFFREIDGDGDGRVLLKDLPEDAREELAGADSSGDGQLTIDEIVAHLGDEEASASFEVQGEMAHMTGVIDASTPERLLELALDYSHVRTIVFDDVPGSMDDEANLFAGRLLRRFGFHTHVPMGGVIASGGVDLFLAGAKRTVEKGARLGVHSWGGGPGETGRDVPKDHEAHQMYLEYYSAIGIPEEFYWFTLEAAPAEDIHWMIPTELERYDMLTDSDDE